ncbi:MAG: transcriptional repressor NrdR [Clostridiales bacterium]|nr:transcriptional repressor NrdR [Clostridiales bacterium]
MKCPYCYVPESKVIDSRPADNGMSIKRRRECPSCGRKFNTYEKVEDIPLRVIKKDGSRQSFEKSKIMNGVTRACEKRPVTSEQIEKLVNEIEAQVYNKSNKEITTLEIGEMVMEGLKDLDDVAYVRFASVYRQFKDVNTFIDELQKLIEK